MKKIRVGIDVDEILRAKWLQFDRFYVQEFGEEGVPKEEPYVFDYFNNYQWNDSVEVIQELKDIEDMSDINPKFYEVDKNTGESLADSFIMKPKQEILVSGIDKYKRFMYEDFLFEIFGSAPLMYRGLDLHVNEFLAKYEKIADFTILSVENKLTIPPTLFFLSKMMCRFNKYRFVDNPQDMWKDIDVLITTNPELLRNGAPFFKKIIKVERPYNRKIKNSFTILHLNELKDNNKFEKIIKYK